MIETGETAAVFADTHFRPWETLDEIARIEAFARYCLKNRVPTIICLGDWFDFASLADYLPQKVKEGMTIRRDLEAGLTPLKLFHNIIDAYNKKQRRAGRSKNQYLPRLVLCKGNHDIRPGKEGKENPKTSGDYSERYIDQDFLDKDWEIIQFKKIFRWQGIRFSHYFDSGSMGRACGILQAKIHIGRSAVWGHTHKFEVLSRQVSEDDEVDRWVSVPALMPSRRLKKNEDNGFLLLTDAKDGDFATQHISYNQLMKEFHYDLSPYSIAV